MSVSRILAAVDLEQHSDIVVGAALRLSDRFSAPLTLLHVAEAMPYYSPVDAEQQPVSERNMERYRSIAVERLRSFVADFASQIEIQHEFREGRPVESILDSVKQTGAELLVMGTHGRRGVEHLLIGSNAARVVRSSPVPVFTVNTRHASYKHLQLERLMLATDFSDDALAAESWAIEFARAFDASLVLAHVVEERFHPYLPYYVSGVDFAAQFEVYLGTTRERYERLIEQAMERIQTAGVKAESLLVEDAVSVSDGLQRAMKESEAQLLVMGTHGRSGLDRAVLGSEAEKMVRLAPGAVLTVRALQTEP